MKILKVVKTVVLLPWLIVKGIHDLWKSLSEYSDQHEYEESGWQKRRRKP
jgi:hypothetical protein